MPADRDGILRLRDGRGLAYAEYGTPAGKPVFYFHGFPGSRLGAQIADDAAGRLGLRVIALDRPGLGRSEFKAGRTIVDWVADVADATDGLKIDRFAVMGHSGGGPYVAACALKIPQRLTAAAIVSGLGPLDVPRALDGMSRRNRLTFTLFQRLPWLTRPAMWYMARQDTERMLSQMSADLAEPDKEVLARPEVRAAERADLAEAFRQGSRGPAWELRLLSRPWGFRLEDIGADIHLWHGEADAWVPPSLARYQARALPNSRATFLPGEGHYLLCDHIEEILARLADFAGGG